MDEQRFLAEYDASAFPHPSVSVDVVMLTADAGHLQVLLVRRAEHPHRGRWALPGGFVALRESLDDAAERVLQQKTGLSNTFLEQLYTFGQPNRDPRTRVITVAFYALIDPARLARNWSVTDDVQLAAVKVSWKGEAGGPARASDASGRSLPLAFDHDEILGLAVKRLRGKLNYAPIGFELLPRRFTLRQLQAIHETILNRRQNKDSFRRRMLDSGLIVATGQRESDVGHRPAELYRFKRRPQKSN